MLSAVRPMQKGTKMFCGGYGSMIEQGKKLDEKFFKSVAFSVQKCGQCGHGRALGPLFTEAFDYVVKKKDKK
jgi:hypothetical protein